MDPDDSDMGEDSWYVEDVALNNWKLDINQPGSNNDEDEMIDGPVLSLVDLAAATVAEHFPYEIIQKFDPNMPDEVLLRITFWSFPSNLHKLLVYTCLNTGSDGVFTKGETDFTNGLVFNVQQIGFSLSGCVLDERRGETHMVVVKFDRCCITGVKCTCASGKWCSHVVSICMHRIDRPNAVQMRIPLKESLARLDKTGLLNFCQCLINQIPHEYLSQAQTILDKLTSKSNDLPKYEVASDPTSGGVAGELAGWLLEADRFRSAVRSTVRKLGRAVAVVANDIYPLGVKPPAVAQEFEGLYRPLQYQVPIGLWSLCDIVRELIADRDRNSLTILYALTIEIVTTREIVERWFCVDASLSGENHPYYAKYSQSNGNIYLAQKTTALYCNEVVSLWRYAMLNPLLTRREKDFFRRLFLDWHMNMLNTVWNKSRLLRGNTSSKYHPCVTDLCNFPGFKSAIEACDIEWGHFDVPTIDIESNNHQFDFGLYWKYDGLPFSVNLSLERHPFTFLSASSPARPLLKLGVAHSRRLNSIMSKMNTREVQGQCDLDNNPILKFLHDQFSASRCIVNKHITNSFPMANSFTVQIMRRKCLLSDILNFEITTDGVVRDVYANKFNLTELIEKANAKHAERSMDNSTLQWLKSTFGMQTAINNQQLREKVLYLEPYDLGTMSQVIKYSLVVASQESCAVQPLTTHPKWHYEIMSVANLKTWIKTHGAAFSSNGNNGNNGAVQADNDRYNEPSTSGIQRPEALSLASSVSNHSKNVANAAENYNHKMVSNKTIKTVSNGTVKTETNESVKAEELSETIKTEADGTTSATINENNTPTSSCATTGSAKTVGVCKIENKSNVDGCHDEPCTSSSAARQQMSSAEKHDEQSSATIPPSNSDRSDGEQNGLLEAMINNPHYGFWLDPRVEANQNLILIENSDVNNIAEFINQVCGSDQIKLSECLYSGIFDDTLKDYKNWDLLFTYMHGLYMHVSKRKASVIAIKLAEAIILRNPSFKIKQNLTKSKKRKGFVVNPMVHTASLLAFETLSKMYDIMLILSEAGHDQLACRIGLCALELARPAAALKSLEISFHDVELKILDVMTTLPVESGMLEIITEKAERMAIGQYTEKGDVLLPTLVALYFINVATNRNLHDFDDWEFEELCYSAAITCLSMKPKVYEIDHPMLSESTRKQRQLLAVKLLDLYRDDSFKLAEIMNVVIDDELDPWLGSPIEPWWYADRQQAIPHILKSFFDSSLPLQPWYRRGNQNRPFPTNAFLLNCFKTVPSVYFKSPIGSLQFPQPPVKAHLLEFLERSDSKEGDGLSLRDFIVGSTTSRDRFKGYKGKRCNPNQPTEALAYHMFELAVAVNEKAGGADLFAVMFTQANNQNDRIIHPQLQLCAFQIAMFSAGVCSVANGTFTVKTRAFLDWLSVIIDERGFMGYSYLFEYWHGHFTPTDMLQFIDHASRSPDPEITKLGPVLAYTCLMYAPKLSLSDVFEFVNYCKLGNTALIEKACNLVENICHITPLGEQMQVIPQVWLELFDIVTHNQGIDTSVDFSQLYRVNIISTLAKIIFPFVDSMLIMKRNGSQYENVPPFSAYGEQLILNLPVTPGSKLLASPESPPSAASASPCSAPSTPPFIGPYNALPPPQVSAQFNCPPPSSSVQPQYNNAYQNVASSSSSTSSANYSGSQNGSVNVVRQAIPQNRMQVPYIYNNNSQMAVYNNNMDPFINNGPQHIRQQRPVNMQPRYPQRVPIRQQILRMLGPAPILVQQALRAPPQSYFQPQILIQPVIPGQFQASPPSLMQPVRHLRPPRHLLQYQPRLQPQIRPQIRHHMQSQMLQMRPMMQPQMPPQIQQQVQPQIQPQMQQQVQPQMQQVQPQMQQQMQPQIQQQVQPQIQSQIQPQMQQQVQPQIQPQMQQQVQPQMQQQVQPQIQPQMQQQVQPQIQPQMQQQVQPQIQPQMQQQVQPQIQPQMQQQVQPQMQQVQPQIQPQIQPQMQQQVQPQMQPQIQPQLPSNLQQQVRPQFQSPQQPPAQVQAAQPASPSQPQPPSQPDSGPQSIPLKQHQHLFNPRLPAATTNLLSYFCDLEIELVRQVRDLLYQKRMERYNEYISNNEANMFANLQQRQEHREKYEQIMRASVQRCTSFIEHEVRVHFFHYIQARPNVRSQPATVYNASGSLVTSNSANNPTGPPNCANLPLLLCQKLNPQVKDYKFTTVEKRCFYLLSSYRSSLLSLTCMAATDNERVYERNLFVGHQFMTIKTLMQSAFRLGKPWVIQFCMVAEHIFTNPFVLYCLVKYVGNKLENIYSTGHLFYYEGDLLSVVGTCQVMFTKQLEARINQLRDSDDNIIRDMKTLLRHVIESWTWTSGGTLRFNDWLEGLRSNFEPLVVERLEHLVAKIREKGEEGTPYSQLCY